MRTRVERRKKRRIEHPVPGRMPRNACDHLRGVLDLDDGKRVILATEPLPLRGDEGVARFVRRSIPKLRPHVSDATLFEKLVALLTAQADKHRETPEELAMRQAEEKRVQRMINKARGWDDPGDDE